jgi:hypothetical protein
MRRFGPIAVAAALLVTAALSSAVPPQPAPALPFAARPVLGGAPFRSLSGIVADGAGSLYVADLGPAGAPAGFARIYKVDIASRLVSTLNSAPPILDPGRLLIGDGRALTGTDLIVSDHNAEPGAPCCNGSVWRVDRVTGAATPLIVGNGGVTAIGDPFGLALGPGGPFGNGLYAMDFQGSSSDPPVVVRVTAPGSAERLPIVTPWMWSTDRVPFDLAFGGARFGGHLFVLDPVTTPPVTAPGVPPTIWRISGDGVIRAFLAFPGQIPAALAFGPGNLFGTNLYVLLENGDLLSVAPDAKAVKVAANVPVQGSWATDMAFSPDGQRLYVTAFDTIYEIVPWQVAPDSIPALADAALATLASLVALLGMHRLHGA